ncbi:uncharacterized protein LY89DRAFT_281505 [Mollisia scopiformis]|uniref:CCD97-like C-terminal domain-containing protein n=1 Tax=Mollisia scopiformis TaxID=149040 RepID=A0A132BBM3_MOLSC|nr:uncharacterized protein LY89DRAFT_281505 [Mollisia scopiformis]KUJ09244.1 hypothetical protein LY89DRAFT_281505 [Mollisia scopiformis]
MPHIQDPNTMPEEDPQVAVERRNKIRIKNRRKLYLDRHPSYFTSPDLELTDPLLYDRCIRRFQSASEREADGKAKGYSGVLEADLYRSEAKLAAIKAQNPPIAEASSSKSPGPAVAAVPFVSYARGENGEVLPEEEDEVPKNKEEGLERWKFVMTLKFLSGEDQDFDYTTVDENDEWDAVERRESEERWFDDEEPEWVADESEGPLHGGETGIQDF